MGDLLAGLGIVACILVLVRFVHLVMSEAYYLALRHRARSRAKASVCAPPDWPNYDHIARLEQWHQQYEAGGIKSAEVIETWDHRGPYLLERTPPPYDPDGPVVHHPEDERLILGPNGWQWAA